MAEKPDLHQQLELMKERLLAGGMSRREVMKVAAATVAGTSVAALAGKTALAAPSIGSRGFVREQTEGEQLFYQKDMTSNPVSFDWNANLYCNADETTFAGLVQYNADLEAVADWAETYAPNEDATVWTFNIRPNNTGWSDGTPVTAGDFVWSWARQLDPATAAPYAGFLFDIKYAEAFNTGTAVAIEGDPLNGTVPTAADLGVRAVDDWTLEVTCEGPRGYLPQVLAYTAAVPAPRWMVEEHGDAWALGGDVPIVSNGPFKVDSWEYDVKVELSKNPGFWDAENIQLTKQINPIYPSANEVLIFEEGSGDQQLDWAVLPGADAKRYSEDPALAESMKPYPYYGIWMMLPSNGQPPFDQLEVRKALSHAIDRDRLAQVTNNLVMPGYCMVPQGVFGYLDDPALAEIQNFDPAAAMEALVGTEFEGGQNWPEITMWMRAEEEVYNADVMANDIADQLQQNLGMTVGIQPVPQSNFTQQLTENIWQLVFIRWWYDYPHPNNGYGDMFYSRKTGGKRQAWSNAEFDDGVIAAKALSDPEEALAAYLELEKIIQEDVGYMPLVYRLDYNVFKPWVTNLATNANGYTLGDGNIYIGMGRVMSTADRPA